MAIEGIGEAKCSGPPHEGMSLFTRYYQWHYRWCHG